MPHKNTIRAYAPGYFYHIYNRGVEKKSIFRDRWDYSMFLSIIESYLTPKDKLQPIPKNRGTPYWRSKLEKDENEMICFCLMPNHFHFLIKQNSKDAITKFMRRISNSYVSYFNKKYDRVGPLFQGKFKAVLIKSESYLLHLSRYIHLNPLEVRPLNVKKFRWLRGYPYSSYPNYLNIKKVVWINPKPVLSFFESQKKIFEGFKKTSTYESFVEKYKEDPKKILGDIALE